MQGDWVRRGKEDALDHSASRPLSLASLIISGKREDRHKNEEWCRTCRTSSIPPWISRQSLFFISIRRKFLLLSTSLRWSLWSCCFLLSCQGRFIAFMNLESVCYKKNKALIACIRPWLLEPCSWIIKVMLYQSFWEIKFEDKMLD